MARPNREFLCGGTNSSNPSPSSEESVANLLQALRAVRFNGSRTGSDRILARIGFVRQNRSSPRITVARRRAVPVPAVVASRHADTASPAGR
jgi:hypothetical protein